MYSFSAFFEICKIITPLRLSNLKVFIRLVRKIWSNLQKAAVFKKFSWNFAPSLIKNIGISIDMLEN